MNWILFFCGCLLLIGNTADLLYTSFSARGSGFLTRSSTKALSTFFVFSSKRLRWSALLNNTGLFGVCYTLLQWVLLAWAANLLIFLSDGQSILNSETKAPVTTLEKIYVVGYTLSTLGNGDYIGGSPLWKIYISITSFTGIIMLTVALSYFLQVLSGVTLKRAFASMVFALGSTPEKLLLNGWNGKDFSRLDQHLLQLATQVTNIAEVHLAYPVLHFYYIAAREKSLAVSVAVLDETLSIIYNRIPAEQWPDKLVLQSLRQSITRLLCTLEASFIKRCKDAPTAPTLEFLRQHQISLLKKDHLTSEAKGLDERRRLLLGWLQDEGRGWDEVWLPVK